MEVPTLIFASIVWAAVAWGAAIAAVFGIILLIAWIAGKIKSLFVEW